MWGVVSLTTIEIDVAGKPTDLEAVCRFHAFNRPVVVSWEGGFDGERTLFEFAQGTLMVYSEDGSLGAERPHSRTRISSGPLEDGILRFSEYNNDTGARWQIVHVLLPKHGIASYLDPFEPGANDHVYVTMHEGLKRISATFIGEQYVRFNLKVKCDEGRWRYLVPSDMFRPPMVDMNWRRNAESFVQFVKGVRLPFPPVG